MRALAVVAVLALAAGGASAQTIFRGPTARFQQNSPQNSEPPGSVSGRVVSAVTGEPVRGAFVNLQSFSRGGGYHSVTSDGTGTFAAANLPPGDYFVQANHASYQGILGLPGPSQMVTVTSAHETSGVTVRLMPGGRISGKVLDDNGEPVSGCPVMALSQGQGGTSAPYAPRGWVATNDKGAYKFDTLTADRYLIYARCQESLPVERPLAVWRPELIEPAESWLPVYYPDSPSPDGAQWLTLLPGSDLTGIDFRLKATPVTTVSGTVGGGFSGEPGSQPSLTLSPAGAPVDASLAFGGSFDPQSSVFKFQMVPPGSYRLVAIGSGAQVESLAYASMPVMVGKAPPAPLVVEMHPGLAVSGVVELPPVASGSGANLVSLDPQQRAPGQQTPKPPPIGAVNLIPLTPTPFSNQRQAEVRQDGAFTVQGLTPGRYRVVAQTWIPQPATTESVQFGSARVEHGVIDVTEGGAATLRVRMAASSSQVSASLSDAPAGAQGDWMVFAVPVDEPVVPFGRFTVGLGSGKSGDTVRLQNIGPGRYLFIAVEMAATGGMQNERLNQLLRQRIEPIEIVAGQERTVSPKFLTSREIEDLALAYLRGETP